MLGRIKVNSKKSLVIKYKKEVNDTEYVMKRSTFIGSVNKLMANFGHLQAPVLSKIFKTFCCNFYGSPI